MVAEKLARDAQSYLIRHCYDIGDQDMFALLAFYERGRTDFLAQVYVDAYQVSAAKYNDLLKMLGDGGLLATLAIDPGPGRGHQAPKNKMKTGPMTSKLKQGRRQRAD